MTVVFVEGFPLRHWAPYKGEGYVKMEAEIEIL